MTFEEMAQKFDSLAHQAQTLTFIARDLDLQKEALASLAEFLDKLAGAKQTSIEAGDEQSANRVLAFELMVSSLASELRMYIDLKAGQPEAAWNHLIDAENYAASAMRADGLASHLTNHITKLEALEELLFGPQSFMSFGSIVGTTECSICGGPYDDCPHVVGRPYMGSLCSVICKDVDIREVSYVTEPADKRCRVTHFSDSGGQRNKITWKLEKK